MVTRIEKCLAKANLAKDMVTSYLWAINHYLRRTASEQQKVMNKVVS